jgi:hypothetical protein
MTAGQTARFDASGILLQNSSGNNPIPTTGKIRNTLTDLNMGGASDVAW